MNIKLIKQISVIILFFITNNISSMEEEVPVSRQKGLNITNTQKTAPLIKEFVKENFNILLEVPSILNTRIIGFAETHDDLMANKNIQQFINLYSKKNAVLLVEGLEMGKEMSAQKLSEYKHIVLDSATPIKGWDDLSGQEEWMRIFKENARKIRENPNQPLIDFDYEKNLHTRNSSMIKAIFTELDAGKFVYVIFGKGHYLGRGEGLQSVQELRDFFKDKGALILEPKKFPRQYSENVQKILQNLGNKISLNYSQFNAINPIIKLYNPTDAELNNDLVILFQELNPDGILFNNAQISLTSDTLLKSIAMSNITILFIGYKSRIETDQTIVKIINNAPKTLKQMRILGTKILKRTKSDAELKDLAKAKNITLEIQ